MHPVVDHVQLFAAAQDAAKQGILHRCALGQCKQEIRLVQFRGCYLHMSLGRRAFHFRGPGDFLAYGLDRNITVVLSELSWFRNRPGYTPRCYYKSSRSSSRSFKERRDNGSSLCADVCIYGDSTDSFRLFLRDSSFWTVHTISCVVNARSLFCVHV